MRGFHAGIACYHREVKVGGGGGGRANSWIACYYFYQLCISTVHMNLIHKQPMPQGISESDLCTQVVVFVCGNTADASAPLS